MGDIESIYPELALYGIKISVLGLILSSSPYLRSAKARFHFRLLSSGVNKCNLFHLMLVCNFLSRWMATSPCNAKPCIMIKQVIGLAQNFRHLEAQNIPKIGPLSLITIFQGFKFLHLRVCHLNQHRVCML